MPVYPVSGGSARCAASGCRCHDRVRAYPSDTTDAQWAVLEPRAKEVMAGLVKAKGRPMDHDLRAVVDAVFYVVKERRGVAGAAGGLPAVGGGVEVLRPVGCPGPARAAGPPAAWCAARAPGPSRRADRGDRGFADRQGRRHVGRDSRGFHGGKEINGKGRHVAVDVEGWLLSIVVTAASVSDRAGARLLVVKLLQVFTTLKLMRADSGYDGAPLAQWVKKTAGITLEIIKRSDAPGFQVVRRRWVVERTFGWLVRYRRLVRDYERRVRHHEAMVYWATVMIMTRRLTLYQTGEPAGHRQARRPRPALKIVSYAVAFAP